MKTVLLAEDHTLVRSGIRLIIEGAGDLKVVAEAADGRHAVRLAAELTPDLALIDLGMPNLNGIEATCQIRRDSSATQVLIVSIRNDYQYVCASLRAGASGYVLKSAAVEELLYAIQQVTAGKLYLSPDVATAQVKDYLLAPTRQRPATDLDKLTGREREVLQLIAEGNSGIEIARHLGLSTRTVDTYRERIMLKLTLHSIADLTRFAIQHGVCSCDPVSPL